MRTPEQILRESKTIALVGASPNPAKPSHGVMRYLLAQGYRVIPVRPADCDEILGVPCVETLSEIDEPIDLVDVFRRPEHTPQHAREAVEAGRRRSGFSWTSGRRKLAGLRRKADSTTSRTSALQSSIGTSANL
jgi:uncharacterized protein